jgi:hypothetical protein
MRVWVRHQRIAALTFLTAAGIASRADFRSGDRFIDADHEGIEDRTRLRMKEHRPGEGDMPWRTSHTKLARPSVQRDGPRQR